MSEYLGILGVMCAHNSYTVVKCLFSGTLANESLQKKMFYCSVA